MDKLSIPIDNNFDLYSHLKCNVKCMDGICEIHDSILTVYCIHCKRAICEVCKHSFHGNHTSIDKDTISMNKNIIQLIFNELEQKIITTEAFSNPNSLVNRYKDKFNKEIDEIITKVERLRTLRLQHIDQVFSKNENEAEILSGNIRRSKEKMTSFFETFRSFLRGKDVPDDDSFIFLQLYDIVNSGMLISKQYIEALDLLREYYDSKDLFKELNLDRLSDILNRHIIDQEKQFNVSKTSRELVDQTVKASRKNVSLREINKLSSFKTLIEMDPKAEMKLTMAKKREKFTENLFSEVNAKVESLRLNIEEFKEHVYDSFDKNGNLNEIEKVVKIFEEKTSKRISLEKSMMRYSNSRTKSGMLSKSKVTLQAISKEKEKQEDEKLKEESRRNSIRKAINPESITKDEDSFDERLVSPKKNSLTSKFECPKKNSLTQAFESPDKKRKDMTLDLFDLKEKDEELEKNENYNSFSDVSDEPSEKDFNSMVLNEEVEVKIEKNQRYNDPTFVKLNEMFKPKPKKEFKKKVQEINPFKTQSSDLKNPSEVNNKLAMMIQQNKKLIASLKCKEDISLNVDLIRKYYTFRTLEFVRAMHNKSSQGMMSNKNILNSISNEKEEIYNRVRAIEGTDEVHIYNSNQMKIIKKKVKFDTKRLKVNHFLIGSRSILISERIYISGGKDKNGKDRSLFLCYDIKTDKLFKLPDLNFARSYHTLSYHETLRILLAVGGEKNSTCEMYDFYLNLWNPMPELKVPRANTSLYIDKVGSFCYSIGGIVGNILGEVTYSDAIEYLDLVELTQGWVKVELKNKANFDLTLNEIKVVPLSHLELLIYGGKESRHEKKGYVIFNMKTLEITKISEEEMQMKKFKISNSERKHPSKSKFK